MTGGYRIAYFYFPTSFVFGADGESEAARTAVARMAQSAVSAVCGARRGAAAVADRAVRDALAARVDVAMPEGDATELCLTRAEANLQCGARSAGKAVRGGELLRAARERYGACTAGELPEDVWCYAAVALAATDEQPPAAEDMQAAAMALVTRCGMQPRWACAKAVAELWKHAF